MNTNENKKEKIIEIIINIQDNVARQHRNHYPDYSLNPKEYYNQIIDILEKNDE